MPSPVRNQCQAVHRSSRARTAESERPPRSKASFVAAKKIGYVTITPTAAKAAIRSHRRHGAGPRQHPTTAATATATPALPSGSISRPMRCEYAANQAWNSAGERLFQKLTNATPITSMPPASKPRTRQVSITRVDAMTERERDSSVGTSSSSQCGASTISASGDACGDGWDMHRARGDALFTARAVLLQLYGVSARRVPRARSRTHERPAPHRQRAYHETEPTPAVGERVRGARRALRVELARHQSLTLHSPQAVGEQLRRYAGQLVTQILESRGAPQQVADDEERPALANQIERLRDWAVLTVPLRHAPKYSGTGAAACEFKKATLTEPRAGCTRDPTRSSVQFVYSRSPDPAHSCRGGRGMRSVYRFASVAAIAIGVGLVAGSGAVAADPPIVPDFELEALKEAVR